jgi:calcineurin-like phosphoesterase family protein
MSRVWYTSDLHFGHTRVSEIRGFDTTLSHDLSITEEWHKTVSKNDSVYVLGDIAVGSPQRALAILNELPGRKHLISGNHDVVHSMHTRGHSKAEQLRWFDTFETIQTYVKRKLNGRNVLLSHFPYEEWGDGEHREGSRYNQYRLPNLGEPLLHGHTHGAEQAHDNMLHVGWDAWGTLVSQETVLDWLSDLSQDSNRLRTV